MFYSVVLIDTTAEEVADRMHFIFSRASRSPVQGVDFISSGGANSLKRWQWSAIFRRRLLKSAHTHYVLAASRNHAGGASNYCNNCKHCLH
jgi:hypothetical protein